MLIGGFLLRTGMEDISDGWGIPKTRPVLRGDIVMVGTSLLISDDAGRDNASAFERVWAGLPCFCVCPDDPSEPTAVDRRTAMNGTEGSWGLGCVVQKGVLPMLGQRQGKASASPRVWTVAPMAADSLPRNFVRARATMGKALHRWCTSSAVRRSPPRSSTPLLHTQAATDSSSARRARPSLF